MKKTPNKPFPTIPSSARSMPTHAETSAKAEALWIRLGRPAGRDDEIWIAAERALSTRTPTFDGTRLDDELEALFPEPDHGEVTSL
jgi:hypothetical protein